MANLEIRETSKLVEVKERQFVLTLNETEAKIIQSVMSWVINENSLENEECYRKETYSIREALYRNLGPTHPEDYFLPFNPLVAKRRKDG